MATVESLTEEFVREARIAASDSVVAIRLFINSKEHTLTIESRDPAALKKDCVSMANLRGDWIVPLKTDL